MALVFASAEDRDADVDTGDVGADVPVSEVNISGLEASPTTAQPTHDVHHPTLLPGLADVDGVGIRAHIFDEGDDESNQGDAFSGDSSDAAFDDGDEQRRDPAQDGFGGGPQHRPAAVAAALGDRSIHDDLGEAAHISGQPSSSSSTSNHPHVRRQHPLSSTPARGGSAHSRPRADSPPVRDDDRPTSLVVVNPLSPPSAVKQLHEQTTASPVDAIRLGEVREESEDDGDGSRTPLGDLDIVAAAATSSSASKSKLVSQRVLFGAKSHSAMSPGSCGDVERPSARTRSHVPPSARTNSSTTRPDVMTDAPEPLMPSRLDVLPPHEVLLLILQFAGENALVLRATCRRLAALFDVFCVEPSFRHLVQPHTTSWVMTRALPHFLRKERLRRARRRVAQWQAIRSAMHASLADYRRSVEPPPPPPPPPAASTASLSLSGSVDLIGRRGGRGPQGLQQHPLGIGSSHAHVTTFHPTSDELAALAQAELNLNPPSANSLTHQLRGIMVRPDPHHLGGGDLPPAAAAASPTVATVGLASPPAAPTTVSTTAAPASAGTAALVADAAPNGAHHGSAGFSSGSSGAGVAGGSVVSPFGNSGGDPRATHEQNGGGISTNSHLQNSAATAATATAAATTAAAAGEDHRHHHDDDDAKAVADTAKAVVLSLAATNRQSSSSAPLSKKLPSGRFRYHYTTEWLHEWMQFRRARYNIRRALFDYVTIEKQSHAMPLILPNGTICFSRWHLVAVFVKTSEKDPQTQQPIPNTSKWIKTGYLGSHTDTVTCMKYDAHLGCLFTSSFDGTVKRWGIRNDLRSDDSYKNEGLFSCLASYRVTVSGAPAPNFHIFTFDIVHLKDYKLTAEDKRPFRCNQPNHHHRVNRNGTATATSRYHHTATQTSSSSGAAAAPHDLRAQPRAVAEESHPFEPVSLYSPTASEQHGSLSSFHTLLVDETLLHVTDVGAAAEGDAAGGRHGNSGGGGVDLSDASGHPIAADPGVGAELGGSPSGIVPPGLDGDGALPHPAGSRIEVLNPSSSLLCCGSEWGGVALLHIDGRHSATLGVTSTTDTRVRQVRFLNQIIFDDGAPNLAADVVGQANASSGVPQAAAAAAAAAVAAGNGVGGGGLGTPAAAPPLAAAPGAAVPPNQAEVGGVEGGGGGGAFLNNMGAGISANAAQQQQQQSSAAAPVVAAGRRHITTPLFQQAQVYLVASTFGGVFVLTHTIYRKVCEVSREDASGILKTKKGYHYFATTLQMTRLYFFQVNELPASVEIPRPWWHRNPLREAKSLFEDVAASRSAAAGFSRGSKAAATASAFENRIADESTDAHPFFIKPLILLVYRRIPCVLATLNPNYNAAAQQSMPFGEGGGPKPLLEKSLPQFLGQATCARISPNHAFFVVALDSGKIVIVSPRVVPITRSERNDDFPAGCTEYWPDPVAFLGGALPTDRCAGNDEAVDEVLATQSEIAAQLPGGPFPHLGDNHDSAEEEEDEDEDAGRGHQRTAGGGGGGGRGAHEDEVGVDMMGVQPEIELTVISSSVATAPTPPPRSDGEPSARLSSPIAVHGSLQRGYPMPNSPVTSATTTTVAASPSGNEGEAAPATAEMGTTIHFASSSPLPADPGDHSTVTQQAVASAMATSAEPHPHQSAATAAAAAAAPSDNDSGTIGSPTLAATPAERHRQQNFQRLHHPHPHPKRTVVIDHAGVEEARAFFGSKIFDDRTIFDWQCRNPMSHWDEFQFLPPDDAAASTSSSSMFHVATLFSPSVEHHFHSVMHMDIDGWKLSTIDVNSTVLVFDLERFAHMITLTMLPAPHHGISMAKSVERAVIAESRSRPANPKYVVWGNSTMLVSPLPITSHTVIVDFSGEFMPLKCTVTQRNPTAAASPLLRSSSSSVLVASGASGAFSTSAGHQQQHSNAAGSPQQQLVGASRHHSEAALALPCYPMPRFEHHTAVAAAGSLSTQQQEQQQHSGGAGALFDGMQNPSATANSSSAGASPTGGGGGGGAVAQTTGSHSAASIGYVRGGGGGPAANSHRALESAAVSVDNSTAREYDVHFDVDTTNARSGIAKISDSYGWLVQNAKHVEGILRLRHGEEGLLALPQIVNQLPGSWMRGARPPGLVALDDINLDSTRQGEFGSALRFQRDRAPATATTPTTATTEGNGVVFLSSIPPPPAALHHPQRHSDEFNVSLRIVPLQEYPFMFHTLYIFAPPVVMIAICGTVTLFALILDGLVGVPFTVAACLHFAMLPHYFGINWYSYKPLLAHHSGVSFYVRVAADMLYLVVFPVLFLLRRDLHLMQHVSWVVLSIPLQLAIAFAFTAARLEDRFEMRHHIALDPNVARLRYVSVSLLQFAETLLVIVFLIAFSAYFDDPLQENSLASSRISIFAVFLPIWIFLLAYAKQLPGLINQGAPDPTQRIRQLLFYYGSILLVYVVYFAVALMPLLGFCLRYNYYYECASHPNGIAVWHNATLDDHGGNHTNTTTTTSPMAPPSNVSINVTTTAAPGPVQVMEVVPCGSLHLPLIVIVVPIIVGLMSVAAFAMSNVVTHVRQLRRGQ